ncbi:MAG: proline--tRNA ligase [Anaerolineaceae bacterium]
MMRMSGMFSQTLREAPTEAQTPGHQFLLRAGFLRQMAAGIYSYLPLAKRSLTKIENIIREEMDTIGGQEVCMPVVLPADIWKETRRWYEIGSEMARLKDRNDRDLVLAMTHEEAVADLARREIRSYKQLPQLIYHIQTKFRDDPRPRAGLIRVREFTMKDSYSLDATWDGLERQYRAHYQAYFNIFRRCGLDVIAVRSDTGMMGGKVAHEYMYLNPMGEDTLMLCDACGFSANRQVARFQKPQSATETPLPLEKVATPEIKTIEALSQFLNIPAARTAKAVFMTANIEENGINIDKLVMAIVRGDMELNETKLGNAIHARDMRPATEEEISASGAVAGFASPVGLTRPLVVVDDLIPLSANLVAGANETGFHLKNVNYGRDYVAQVVTDIAAAQAGDPCPDCGSPLHAVRGIEVGNIFQLGTRYSDAMGCTFQDENGENQSIIMGSYGIGVGRLLGCVAETFHDDAGLKLPVSIAPYQVQLVLLHAKNDSLPVEVAEKVYQELQQAGIEVLFDDRQESPGVKFNDADLIGCPIRVTVSQRSLQNGGFEVKRRDQTERSIIANDQLLSYIYDTLEALEQGIEDTLVEVPYKE